MTDDLLNDKPAETGQSSDRLAAAADEVQPPNPFDPASLKLSQDFASSVGVKRVITRVPVRKPNRHEFVRVHPAEDHRLETAIAEDKTSRESYLVDKPMWSELPGELFPVCLWFTVNRNGDLFLWPTKLPGFDGKSNAWNETSVDATKLAIEKWIRLAANMTAGMYDTFEAEGKIPDPTWPNITFEKALELAFRDRFIKDHDHPFLLALRGAV